MHNDFSQPPTLHFFLPFNFCNNTFNLFNNHKLALSLDKEMKSGKQKHMHRRVDKDYKQ